jgi:hypothetical protein
MSPPPSLGLMNWGEDRAPYPAGGLSQPKGIVEGTMADGQYFRDLGRRFDELRQSHDRREELEALYTETPQAHYAAQLGVNAKIAIHEGESDYAYARAREAAHAGRAALDGVAVRCHYCFAGPADPTTLQSLEDQWSALATLGAVATGQADSSRHGWLDLLRTRSAYSRRLTGPSFDEGEAVEAPAWLIKQLCRASTELCLLLEGEAAAAIASKPSRAESHVPGHQRATPPRGDEAASVPWSAIEIRILSDERVQLHRDGRAAESLNFAEMGFGDLRKGSDVPIAAWSDFISLATAGSLRKSGLSGKALTQREKTAQTIRQRLRRLNPSPDDPLPLVAGHYKPAFKITRSRAADV